MTRALVACMAVALIALGAAAWYWRGEAETARADAASARAELAGVMLAQAARDAAQEAQAAAHAANEVREREHAKALSAICGDDLADADYFRALDGLLHKTAGAGAPAAGCGPADGLRAPGRE